MQCNVFVCLTKESSLCFRQFFTQLGSFRHSHALIMDEDDDDDEFCDDFWEFYIIAI